MSEDYKGTPAVVIEISGANPWQWPSSQPLDRDFLTYEPSEDAVDS